MTTPMPNRRELPDDTHLAYTVAHEAWYWRNDPDELPRIMVAASAEGRGSGVRWEFAIEDYTKRINTPAIRLAMFDEAWCAFTEIPEFFDAFATMSGLDGWNLGLVRELLDELGAVDETVRESPYVSQPETLAQVDADLAKNGHGHVVSRSDMVVARCGGPKLCRRCASDLRRVEAAEKRAATQ